MSTHPAVTRPESPAERLIEFLQTRTEHERVRFARELHDDLGGLMIGAIMDIAWVQQQPGVSEGLRERLGRVLQTLRSGVDLKRRMVERLRPSLLEDMGLYSALGWLLRSMADAAGVASEQQLEGAEPHLSEGTALVVYRLVQDSLELLLGHAEARMIRLFATLEASELHLRLETEEGDARTSVIQDLEVPLLAAIRYRAQSLSGDAELSAPDPGMALLTLHLHL